jgi:hypothetical protein
MAGLFLWDIMIDKNLDTSNKYAVGSNRRVIVIRNPPRAEMTEDEAIMLVPGDLSFDSFTNETGERHPGLVRYADRRRESADLRDRDRPRRLTFV